MNLGQVLTDHGIAARGIVHVGAHRATEVPYYHDLGFDPIVLVEPNPHLAAQCRARWPGATVIEAAAGRAAGTTRLYVPQAGTQWASIYRPRKPVQDTLTVPMVALATVVGPEVNVLVADVQGAELDVVDGANLDRLDLVVLETCDRDRYAGAPRHAQVLAHMDALGWDAVEIAPHPHGRRMWDVAFTPRDRR